MRFVHALLISLLALPLAVWAQTVTPSATPSALTEAEAVRLALARADWLELERGIVQAAEADVQAADQRPNPTLSYSHERMGGATDSVAQSWLLSQDFDLAGRRALRREAAQRRVQAVTSENEQHRLELADEVRRTYVDVLFSQSVIRATESWVTQFRQVEGLVEKQVRAGEASGFDRRRLARERQGAAAKLAEERANLSLLQARLSAWVGNDAHLVGNLMPQPLPPLNVALAQLDQRPELRALTQHAEAADMEGRAARTGGIPDLTVGIGPKWSKSQGVQDNGFVFEVSIPLPVFDRQQAGQRRSLAEASRLRAEQRQIRARAVAEITGLHQQAMALRQAAMDYRNGAVAASPDLIKVAESAYRGGESSLIELLDAYRSALETEIAALELEKRAREARINYDLMTGSLQ
jgi:cobalt-zinc-cadmium efflux system outer membrane protein